MSELRTLRCVLYHEASGNALLEFRTLYPAERTLQMTPDPFKGIAVLIAFGICLYYILTNKL
jgi:hypothetical protein